MFVKENSCTVIYLLLLMTTLLKKRVSSVAVLDTAE